MAGPPDKKPKRRQRATKLPDVALRGPDTRASRQSPLFSDPMPDRVEPCLTTLAARPPTGPQWAFEVKWDGYRLAVHLAPAGTRILTRGGHDWTHRFPTIAAGMRELEAGSAILDGEAVVLDAEGRPSFALLQQALGGRGGKRVAPEVLFYAFDLLYVDGRDLRAASLGERRAALTGLLAGVSPEGAIRLSEEIDSDGATFLRTACELGLEGIVCKDRRKPYRSGRGSDWIKVKCVQSDTFAVVGYEPSERALGKLGTLLLAAYDGEQLRFVGGVGTGFTAATAAETRRQLDAVQQDRPPVPLKRKGVIWTAPVLAAEVEYRGWTKDGMLRHPSFKGLRDAADAPEIYRRSSSSPS